MNLMQNSGILHLASGAADSSLQATRPDGGLLLAIWSACRFGDKDSNLHIATRIEAFFSASELQRAVNNERSQVMP